MTEPTVRGETTIRVRYAETDRMGLVHHANYLVYFEQARTELLRSFGLSYRDLEDQGYRLVLTRVEVRYKRPAFYDDLLSVRTTVAKTTAVRIDHAYEVFRDGTLIAEANTTLACVDREGRPQPLPDVLRGPKGEGEAMSRWFATAALGAALVLSSLSGCGPSAPPTSGKGGSPTSGSGPAATGKPTEADKATPRTTGGHHDPG